MNWQKGSHRIRFGFDYEHMHTKVVPWDACILGCLSVYSTENVQSMLAPYGGAAAVANYFPTLPSQVRTTNDLLNLPPLFGTTNIYSGFPVGNGTFPGYYEHDQGGINQRIQPYVADTWRVKDSLTVNFGVGYDVETGIFYSNIPRPQYLAPILEGQTGGVPYGLGAPQPNKLDFAPQIGFSWAVDKSKKTVIRGGAGIYWDTNDIWNHFREGGAIGPIGDGRVTLSAQSYTNIFPGIVAFANSASGVPTPVPVGTPLSLNTLTNLTLGQWIQIYNAQTPALQQRFGTLTQTSGPITVSGLDIAKTGIEIFPSKFPLPRTYQTSIGVQRDLGHEMVLTVDYARRIFVNTNLGEEDLNRSTRYIGGKLSPVIPQCTAAQLYVAGQECSNGTITIWDPEGRSVYDGLLAKLTKRFSNRYQFTASYALQKQVAVTVVNLDNLFAGYGPVLPKQNFNFASVINLPWGFSLSINSSFITKAPTTPVVAGVDLNGSGNTTFPITEADPNLKGYNCFNYGCSKADLIAAVNYWNTNIAVNGAVDARGVKIPQLPVPTHFQFNDPLISQDMRLTKAFTYKERYKLAIFGEAFNVLNIANLAGYSTVLNTAAFGQPTARFAQIFGSGGPRALQVGTRISF